MTLPKNLTIRLNPGDNVVVAAAPLEAGQGIAEEAIVCRDDIPDSHKVATGDLMKGQAVLKYGQFIGVAARDIRAGEHVHTHNMKMLVYDREYAFGTAARPTPLVSEKERASFQGIVRADGRVATRNYIGVMASASCSSSVARFIADTFAGDALAGFPNVDGVVSIVHGSGCGLADHGDGIDYLERTLAGWARHPNFAGMVLVGLGCEINQIDAFTEKMNLVSGPMFCAFNIQGAGGTRKSVQRGVEAVEEMLHRANQVERRPVPASHLVVGLECGGSDALSGITANPALGAASDLVVRHGGTVILSETTEIYGAEQLLTQRAESEEVGRKLVERIRWS